MDVTAILKTIGEQINACATGKLAFGEAISVADRTIVPVAWVRYDFGAGGGAPAVYRKLSNEAGGGGGGGQVSVLPAGFVEITSTRTRFVPIPDAQKIFALIAASFGNTGMNNGGQHNPRENAGSNTAGKKAGARKAAGKKIAGNNAARPARKKAALNNRPALSLKAQRDARALPAKARRTKSSPPATAGNPTRR